MSLDLLTYHHEDSTSTIIRTEAHPTIPSHVNAVLEFVGGLHTFPVPTIKVEVAPNGKTITPLVLQKLYA